MILYIVHCRAIGFIVTPVSIFTVEYRYERVQKFAEYFTRIIYSLICIFNILPHTTKFEKMCEIVQ